VGSAEAVLAVGEGSGCSGQITLGPLGCVRGHSGFEKDEAGRIMVTVDERVVWQLPAALGSSLQSPRKQLWQGLKMFIAYAACPPPPPLKTSCETVPCPSCTVTLMGDIRMVEKSSVHTRPSACCADCSRAVLLEGRVKVMRLLLFGVSSSYCIQVSF